MLDDEISKKKENEFSSVDKLVSLKVSNHNMEGLKYGQLINMDSKTSENWPQGGFSKTQLSKAQRANQFVLKGDKIERIHTKEGNGTDTSPTNDMDRKDYAVDFMNASANYVSNKNLNDEGEAKPSTADL